MNSLENDAPPLILVVDDERAIRALLRAILQNSGYRVSEAANGKEALQALDREPPCAMLLDISMPDMDGFELLREIRATGRRAKVIALSGFATNSILPAAEKLGAFGVIAKPFNAEQIIAEVRRALAA